MVRLQITLFYGGHFQVTFDPNFSTATGVLIAPNHFFFMNIGDSRSVLCSDQKVSFSTSDHKPTNQDERDRIEAAGGHVTQGRVNGQLAVSRALGTGFH